MNEQYQQIVTNAYGEIITPIDTSKPYAVSFQGSQKPFEFFSAWEVIDEQLKDIKEPTFLEVGAFKGLWAIAFFEWCKLEGKKGSYYAVSWMEHNPENKDLLKVLNHYKSQGFTCELVDKNSQLDSTQEYLTSTYLNKYSMVLIDADHRYNGVFKDITLYSKLASKLLMFHDIKPEGTSDICGVYRAIVDSNILFDYEISCASDQMGIGIKIV